jgi:hypothetical protein
MTPHSPVCWEPHREPQVFQVRPSAGWRTDQRSNFRRRGDDERDERGSTTWKRSTPRDTEWISPCPARLSTDHDSLSCSIWTTRAGHPAAQSRSTCWQFEGQHEQEIANCRGPANA